MRRLAIAVLLLDVTSAAAQQQCGCERRLNPSLDVAFCIGRSALVVRKTYVQF